MISHIFFITFDSLIYWWTVFLEKSHKWDTGKKPKASWAVPKVSGPDIKRYISWLGDKQFVNINMNVI